MAIKNHIISLRRFAFGGGKKEIISVLGLFLLFLILRIPLLNFIYHQDEHKWARIVDPFFGIQGKSVHPPFTEIIFYYFGQMFGYLNLRWLILIFAIFCFWLIYKIAREQYGKNAAIFSLLLFTVIPYNVIANIQIDIDGAILPFWILLAFLSFTKIDFFKFKSQNTSKKWLVVFIISLIGGFLSKISFILILPGLFFIFLRQYNLKLNYKLIAKAILTIAGAALVLSFMLWILHILYPQLSPFRFLEYITHFSLFNFSGRNYFQVLFLTTKAVLLLSPFIILFLGIGNNLKKYEFWLWYVVSGVLFYLILFDFSNRTIDRYMMFLILPLVFIGGDMLANWSEKIKSFFVKNSFLIGLPASLAIALFLVLSHNEILPLVPKIAYIENIKNFDFSFLLPFSSGSGPIGFYMSVKFILSFWLLSFIAFVLFFRFKNHKAKTWAFTSFVSLALVYSLVFGFELAHGYFYGSPDKTAHKIFSEAVNNNEVQSVITYNDAGSYELDRAGKRKGRFYTQPVFQSSTIGRMKQNQRHYTVLDFPEINKETVFWQYLQSCETAYHFQDKRINGYIFNCQNADINILE